MSKPRPLNKIRERYLLVFLFGLSFLLRTIVWSRYPPGFTADEAVMGYDAYSLLKTGKDQFGTSWPLAFRSFGDYRPPIYIYTTMPFVAVFGLSPLAVRLPSMIAGAFEVVLIYFLGKRLFSRQIGATAAILLSLSPWSLLHTRFAQEANLSTLLILVGVTSFILWNRHRRLSYAVGGSFFFALSLYAYHNARMTMPLLMIGGWRVVNDTWEKRWRHVLIAVGVGVIVVLPLFVLAIKNPGTTFRRASGQSVFSDPGIKIALWNDITSKGPNYPIWLARLQHNKPLYYGKAIVRSYFSHFDPRFLFLTGDPHERFRTPYSGLLNWTMVLFIPIGFVQFIRGDRRRRFILWWLFVSPVVASFSTIVPNSQHVQDMMIPLHLIGGVGAVAVLGKLGKLRGIGKIGSILLAGLYILSFGRFSYGYTQTVPRDTRYLQTWHYYGNLFEKLRPYYGERIVFLGGQYYINLAFFLKYDPATFQNQVYVSQPENLAEFDHVESFGTYEFRKTRNIPKILESEVTYVRLNEEGEVVPGGVNVIDHETWPDGKREYVVFRLLK